MPPLGQAMVAVEGRRPPARCRSWIAVGPAEFMFSPRRWVSDDSHMNALWVRRGQQNLAERVRKRRAITYLTFRQLASYAGKWRDRLAGSGASYFLAGGRIISHIVGRPGIAGGLLPIIILIFAAWPRGGLLRSRPEENAIQSGASCGKYARSTESPNASRISFAIVRSCGLASGLASTVMPTSGRKILQGAPQSTLVSNLALSITDDRSDAKAKDSNLVHSSPSKTKRSTSVCGNLESLATIICCCSSVRVLGPMSDWSLADRSLALAVSSRNRAISVFSNPARLLLAFRSSPSTAAASRDC